MSLISKQVKHGTFGMGNIVECNDSYIEVQFETSTKKFVFPDVFERHITLVDQSGAEAKLIREKIQAKEEEYKKEALRIKKEKALKQEELDFLKRKSQMKNRRIDPDIQSVFWCEDQEEEKIFTEWKVFTGTVKSGDKKGQPKRLARITQNSACLITSRESDMAEENRLILGAFMVDESFDVDMCEDGYIPAHPVYRIRLSKQESDKMLFWNYYVDKRFPNRMTWNSGRQRYFDNIWMAQILRDIVSLRQEPQEREEAQNFFSSFCKINRINEEELPKANGALIHTESLDS